MNCTYYYKSKIGFFKIEIEKDKLIGLNKVNEKGQNIGLSSLLNEVKKELDEYFKGERKTFDIPYTLKGTPFQMKVWEALSKIPYGEVVSYKYIAEKVGCPKGFRAVGMANNRNPISIIIPCHRVIGINGSLVGYGGGIDTKKYLLDLEAKYK